MATNQQTRVALVFAAMEEPGFKPATVSNAEHLGLAYLAGALREQQIDVTIINGELEGLTSETVVSRLVTQRFDLIGFSPVSLSMKRTLAIVSHIRERLPGTVIVLGGHLASMCAADIMAAEASVDMILAGDAEFTFPMLINAITGSTALDEVPGLYWREGAAIRKSATPPPMMDIDLLPRPARDGLAFLKSHGNLQGARILASRGCVYNCSFCTTPNFYGRSIRFRAPECVIREMDDLSAEYGIRHFWFNDDLFVNGSTKNTKWIESFAALLRTRNFTFRVLCRADSFREKNRHVLGLLKEAGLVHVFLGLESGSPGALAVYNKLTTVEKNREAVFLMKGAGIAVQIGFIMFNPYSTPEELIENARFLYDIGELYRFFPLTLAMSAFPGTPIVDRLIGDGLMDRLDYRRPLHCFRYMDKAVAKLVNIMHGVYEREHELDAHILRSLGYDGRNTGGAIRQELQNINLRYFEDLVDAVTAGEEASSERIIESWPTDIARCLKSAWLAFPQQRALTNCTAEVVS